MKEKGFTLVELLVVILIMGILFVTITSIFNPLAQLQKAKNSTRQHDLNQIKSALDTYYNDTGCYPTSLSFGGSFLSGKTTYMEKVPSDPECTGSNASSCYIYQTNGSNCPQWNILYAQMRSPIDSTIPTCVVATAPNCLPKGGLRSYNYCAVSGKLDCTYLSQNTLPTPTIAPPTPTSSGPTPTPNGFNCNPGAQLSACSAGNCDVESASQCIQCGQGGGKNCYQDLVCGHPGTNGQGQPLSQVFCNTQ